MYMTNRATNLLSNFFILLALLIFGFTSVGQSQTGPAGIGNSGGTGGEPKNVFWFDAASIAVPNGNDVTTWTDGSGNSVALGASAAGGSDFPTFATNAVNGLPVVRFDGNSQRLVRTSFADMPTNAVSVIIVTRETGVESDGSGVLSYAVSGESNEYLIFNRNNIVRTFTNGTDGGTADFTGNFDIFSTRWRASDGNARHNLNGTQTSSVTLSTAAITTGGALAFGGEQDAVDGGYATNQDLIGDIAEVIMFDTYLSDAQQRIIENYLSQKYNISISNDLFGIAAGYDASFINDFRGIGRGQDNIKQSTSQASGALQVEETNNSLETDNEFVMYAHNSAAYTSTTANIAVSADLVNRWGRSWFVESTGAVGTKLRFDFGEAGMATPPSASNFVLLFRSNTSDDFVRVAANSYTLENGDQIVVDYGNIAIPSGYYTIGVGQPIVPRNVYSFQSGNWNNSSTWTTDPAGADQQPLGGLTPNASDNVTIISGDVVTMTNNNNDALNLTVNGTLNMLQTTDHDYINIVGNGTISFNGDASSNSNFPTGSTNVFADSIVGGTVIIRGAGINLNQNRLFNNVVINMTNAATTATLLSNYTINGDLTIERGILRINDNTSTVAKNITTYGDVQVLAAGEINVGTANARHEFNFYGDFNNQGRVEFTNRTAPNYGSEATNGIVDANFLNDNKNQTIDCFGVTNFYRILIDKGASQTYILDINAASSANFNLFGAADYGHSNSAQLSDANNRNALALIFGTVRLNNNVNVPVLSNNGNYNISENARIWVNGGNLSKPSGSAIVPYGTLQLSAGTINAPVSNGVTIRGNGNIIVSDGVLTTNQIRTSVLGPENIGGYNQSGGVVNVTGNAIQTEYYAFSLTYSGNAFIMSGGELNVGGAPNGATTGGVFIASSISNQNVTGGTVTMIINRNNNYKFSSTAPFWNVNMRKTSGTGSEVDFVSGTSGTGSNASNILNPTLRVLNDLIIETGVTFDHNGLNVEIGSDFTIQAGADYVYDVAKPNTTIFNGTDNCNISLFNRSGSDLNNEQLFWNFVVDRPSGKTLSLLSNKNSGGDSNNLLRIVGNRLELSSGTLNQNGHSIRMLADTLINYDELMIFNPIDPTNDALPNGNNDLLKFRPSSFVLITADTSVFGNVRLNNENEIITLISDVSITRLDYNHGRIDINTRNLKIDRLDVDLRSSNTRTDEDSGGNFSVQDMIITSGNASDGGLSLYVPASGINPGFIDITGAANTTGNPTVYYFPVGTGITGVDATSEFTPANIRLASATDDGYITVKVVTKKLATAGPYPLGNAISDRYWIVDYEGFSTVPKVERILFRSIDRDDPNGAPSGFPANYVPGYILEDSPFTRTAEINAGNGGNGSGIINNSARDLRIYFWGDTGSGNPAGGFDLVNAAYTAGEASKFVGQPEQFYVRVTDNFNDQVDQADDWDNGNHWSLVSHTGPAAGDFPQEGDIAFVRAFATSGERKVILGIENYSGDGGLDVDIARLIFEQENVNEASRAGNRIMIEETANVNFGSVEGNATFQVFVSNSSTPIFNDTDFGNFVSRSSEGSRFLFYGASDGILNLPPEITEYPNVRFEGDNNVAIDRFFQFSTDATINGDLLVDDRATFRINRNVTVTDDFQLGAFNQGFLQFDGSNGAVTLDVADDFRFRDNGDNRILINNSSSSLKHKIIVRGNIEANANTVSEFDLFTDLINGDNVILELATDEGESANFENLDGIVPQLYKVVMNGGNSKLTNFTFNTNFTLPDANASFQNIEIANGELTLNNADIDILIADGADFVIPGSGSLRLNQGLITLQGDDTGILLDGCLAINGGTLNMDDAVGNGNNFIEYGSSGNALLQISAGSLTVGSQIRPNTSNNDGVLKYRQTGGDVRIGTQAGPEGTRGMLQIYNTGSEFTYTGGSLVIERHQTSPTISALYLNPDVRNVTGSTINIFNANTPAGQNNFGINSFIPLNNLVIGGNNTSEAILRNNPLTLNGDLTINSLAKLFGNALTLTVGGDMVNDGIYNGQLNETIFNASATQQLTGTGTNTFFNFTKAQTGVLDLTNTITVNGLFKISEGTLNDNGNTISLLGDAVIDGIHTSSGGNGLEFNGSSAQELRRSALGTGFIGMMRVNNTNGVNIPAGNSYTFEFSEGLQLNGGVFSVGGSNINFGANAFITPVQPFAVTNMIRTNSSFSDQGVTKTFTSGFNNSFTFPIGETFYTPAIFDFSVASGTSGSSQGSISVRTATEFHPTVNDGNDFYGDDRNNVLQYYWTLRASNINNMIADVSFFYNQSDVAEQDAAVNEATYIPARILAFNNPSNLINKFTTSPTTVVDPALNTITFSLNDVFNGVGSNFISGDYFAGDDRAIPDNVVTYTSIQNGDADAQTTYSPTPALVTGNPLNGSVLVVSAGTEVRFNVSGIRLYKTVIEPGGVLNIDGDTESHRLGIVEGTGNLKITSNTANAGLPLADYGTFLSCAGGGLEYAGTGNYGILNGPGGTITNLRNLTLSGTGDRVFPNANVNICEDLTLEGATVNSTFNQNIRIEGDLILNSGTFNTASSRIFVLDTAFINGGSFNGVNRNKEFFGPVLINGGNLGNGSLGITVIRDNLILISGSFTKGTGSNRILFTDVNNQTITGDFTGSNSFGNFQINKSSNNLNVATGIAITGELRLTDGLIVNSAPINMGISASVDPSRGQNNSYITGKVSKPLNAGNNFTFPIGSLNRWRPASLFGVNAGYTWEAQFFARNVVTNTIVDDMSTSDPTVIRLQQGEYFVISDNSAGGVASSVGLSWGTETDVAASSSDRGQLRVMVYNTVTSDWDNLGGTSQTGNINSGSLRSTSAQTFSEKIFIIGSTDAANPLPVELIDFKATLNNGYVKLDWETASEKDNDFFEIQRSYDGKTFEAIGVEEGNGTTLSGALYNFIDYAPLSGTSYYRLKQVDFDGDYEYSPVVSVTINKASHFSIVPNPTTDQQVNLRLDGFHPEQTINVKIFNLQGASMFTGQFSPNELWNSPLPITTSLNSGIYIVEVVQGNTKKQVRLAVR